MISYGERFAIVLPSIFYFVLSIINSLEIGKLVFSLTPVLSDEETEIMAEKFKMFVDETLVTMSSGTFLEFIILSITNGLSVIFVLNEPVTGAFFIIIGVIISLFGFTYAGVEKNLEYIKIKDSEDEEEADSINGDDENSNEKRPFHHTKIVDTLTTMLSMGEIGYIGFYGFPIIKSIPIEIVPWLPFFTGLIIGYVFDKYLLDLFYP